MGAEISSEKTILSCESGRMVIIEQTERERADNARVLELAQAGKEEGYVLYSETSENGVLEPNAPGLFLSILVRPVFHAERAGLLSAATAVAVARAMERVADLRVSIRWVNDLFCGGDKLAAMMTSARVRPNGYFDYAVIGITVSLSPMHFGPRLGDVVRRVFNGELRPLSTRLTEAIVYEFFSIYDKMGGDRSFLAEYRSRSTLMGKRVKVLLGDTYVPARVSGIGEDASLHVRLKNGNELAVASRSEIVF
ncbi:MAG: hypothetical protein IJ009_03050 [Clostridia bacterium]|nr:hypothetical protein [Clostridia bacterium]